MAGHDTDVPIVLVHGFWVTPRSWERWVERYQSRGYRVLAPAYPGLEVEVEALREDPAGSILKIYPGGTHSLGDTSKDQLNADLLAFIRS